MYRYDSKTAFIVILWSFRKGKGLTMNNVQLLVGIPGLVGVIASMIWVAGRALSRILSCTEEFSLEKTFIMFF